MEFVAAELCPKMEAVVAEPPKMEEAGDEDTPKTRGVLAPESVPLPVVEVFVAVFAASGEAVPASDPAATLAGADGEPKSDATPPKIDLPPKMDVGVLVPALPKMEATGLVVFGGTSPPPAPPSPPAAVAPAAAPK